MAQYITLNENQKNEIIAALTDGGGASSNSIATALIGEQGGETSTEINYTSISNFVEDISVMVITENNNVNFDWRGGGNIGASATLTIPIPATATKIKCDVTVGGSYYPPSQNFPCSIAVYGSNVNQMVVNTSLNWLAIDSVVSNNYSAQLELDLSGINTDVYLYFLGTGWDATFTNVYYYESDGTMHSIYDILSEINNSLQDILTAIEGGGQ